MENVEKPVFVIGEADGEADDVFDVGSPVDPPMRLRRVSKSSPTSPIYPSHRPWTIPSDTAVGRGKIDPMDLRDEKIMESPQGFLEMNKVMKKRWSICLPKCPMGEYHSFCAIIIVIILELF